MEFEVTITIKDIDIEVKFNVTEVSWGNSGIGPYEYWGAKGYDRGVDYIEEYTIEGLEVISPVQDEYIPIKKGSHAYEILADAITESDRVSEIIEEAFSEKAAFDAHEREEAKYDRY